jgi:acyl-CoA thioesterase-2
MPNDTDSLQELLQLIQLEPLEVNLFRGKSRDIGTSRVFGGQVLCQAVLAASQTVEGRLMHSLHAYFLRAGDPFAPIVYNVDRSRNGRSFTARRVVAIQHGKPIFTMSASFQVKEQGLEHQFDEPEVPGPDELAEPKPLSKEELLHLPEKVQRWIDRFGPFEFRLVGSYDPLHPVKQEPAHQLWFRLRGELPDDPVLARGLLAYVSDFHLIGTATLPHGLSMIQGDLVMASLDHAMWFHRDFRLDDWFLYVCDSPSTSGGRGLARGMIYNRAGTLVASAAQEGMIRVRRDSQSKENE